jgi:hypothetical protein
MIAAGLLAALRGDVAGARSYEESIRSLRNENPEVQANLLALVAAVAEADGDVQGARAAAADALGFRAAVGINVSTFRWSWTAAARLAHEAEDLDDERTLLTMLREHRSPELAPLLRAERDLAEARLAAVEGSAGAAARLASAVAAVRALGNPYELAHALLDEAAWLTTQGTPEAAAERLGEATAIGERLGAGTLLARATRLRSVAALA